MKTTNFLTTVEFARLCGTTRDTLFLYDRMGLLKPSHIADNGYRLYNPRQFYDYDLIRMFKQAGSSLSEIKTCLSTNNFATFLQIFQERRQVLQEQHQQLVRMENALDRLIRVTEEGMGCQPMKPELIYCEDEYLLTTQVCEDEWESESTLPSSLLNHLHYCEQFPDIPIDPIGCFSSWESFLNDSFEDGYLFSQLSEKFTDSRVYTKKSGYYLCIYVKGHYGLYSKAKDLLVEELERRNLKTVGSMFQYDVINFLQPEYDDSVITKLLIGVEPAQDDRKDDQ